MLHELAQRLFPQHENTNTNSTSQSTVTTLAGDEGIRFLITGASHVSGKGVPTVHLENMSANGIDTKEWIGEAQANGMALSFSRTGNTTNTRFFDINSCHNKKPLDELVARATRKLREGYWLVPDKCKF